MISRLRAETAYARRDAAAAVASPTILAVTLVLGVYLNSASHWTNLLRPLVIVVVVTAAVSLLLLWLLKRPSWTLILGLLAVCAAMGDWFRFWVIVELVVAWGGLQIYLRLRRRQLARAPITPISIVVVAFLLVAIASLWTKGALATADFVPVSSDPPRDDGALPSIYVLLLDGYPRQDTLATEFGLDISSFESELEDLGFKVYENATADYFRTELTLASMLADGAPEFGDVDYGEYSYELRNARRDVRRELLSDPPILEDLTIAGYETAYIPPPVGHVVLGGWHQTAETGQLTEFETVLLQRSGIGGFFGSFVMHQHAERVRASLVEWRDLALLPGQQVVFAHIDSPHPPFLFRKDGTIVDQPPACWYEVECNLFNVSRTKLALSPAEYTRGLGEQITYLNGLVIEALRPIVEREPEAIVVVFSDHGARVEDEPSAEWHRTFLAARIPPEPTAMDEDPGPDQLLRRLLASAENGTARNTR